MKRRNLAALTLALCLGLTLAGCSGKEEEPEAAEPETPAMQEIGDPSALLETELTNKLGGTITGLSVKKPEKAAYPANLMLADQQIEEEETVQFFYDPEKTKTTGTEENGEEEETSAAAVLPDTEAVGYWNMAKDTKEELTIWDVTDDVVTFRLWWENGPVTRDLMVSFSSGNSGTFAGVIGDDSMISGTMTFTETAVTLDIKECTYEGLDLGDGPFVFDEKHAQSWEYADDYKTSDAEDETDVPAEEQAVETENTDDTYLLQVTMADDKVYELSSFDIADMDVADLCLENDLAYLSYVSLATGAEVSTREQEETIKKEKEAAQPVIDEITLIGTVSEDSRENIEKAREAYNALTDAEKACVTNEAALRWKEITLTNLTTEEEEPEPADTYEEAQEDEEDTEDEDFDFGADDYEEYRNEEENQDDTQEEAGQDGWSEEIPSEDWTDRYNDFGNDRRDDRNRWGGGWN